MTNKYFKEACSWADDKFGLVQASRARYQLAFYISMGAVVCLALAIACMAPLKSVQTVAVHHYENGVTTVDTESADESPKNRSQVESDIVRYLINRESYDISSYRSQFELVHLLSNDSVAKEYESMQSTKNDNSPINQLGTKVTRNVHVYSINFMDNEQLNEVEQKKTAKNHGSFAEVVFSITDYDKTSNRNTTMQYSALVSWHYIAPPASIKERWKNFDGFEVTRYSKVQRNVKV